MMRQDLVPAAEAREIILRNAAPVATETIPVGEAEWRVLAQDLAAKRTQPPFAASAMDGFAVRHGDLDNLPVRLEVIGKVAAGQPFAGYVGQGQAVRIFTGAPIPDGADTVVIQENTEIPGDGSVVILKSGFAGQYARRAGLDFREGDNLLHAGDVLDPPRLSLAASMNHSRVTVWRKPIVALMATGDELVAPGQATGPGQIIASNTFGLAAIAGRAGGLVLDLGIVGDSEELLRAAIEKAIAAGADLILTTGGASVGEHDLVKPVLLAMGAQLYFAKIAMRPGKPMLAGEIEMSGRTVRLVGLAGNPVSSLVAGTMFVRPLVSRMAGLPDSTAAPVNAILGRDLPANDEREDYMRSELSQGSDGRLIATPFELQDSSMLAALARADAHLIRPANAPPAKKGDSCKIVPLRQLAT
jgi:molybdopterin molybdotransferase